jgi:hypothetical protein
MTIDVVTDQANSVPAWPGIHCRCKTSTNRASWECLADQRAGTIDNYGEFMLTDPFTNAVVAGFRFDISAVEVIAYCSEESNRPAV